MLAAFVRKHSRQFWWTVRRASGLDRFWIQRWLPLTDGDRATIRSWVDDEVAPWRGFDTRTLDAGIDALNGTRPTIFIYDINGPRVTVRPKPHDTPSIDEGRAGRVEDYRKLLSRAATGRDFSLTLAFDVADLPETRHDCPVFTFQKPVDGTTILFPDPDFITHGWYGVPQDRRPYSLKKRRAVFAGSSTGSIILTQRLIETATPPRLRLAAAAIGHPRIDITIRAAVQCEDADAERVLKARPYFVDALYPLKDQFSNRYMISIDGNGPTCSRVVHTLLSNSVLLKQRSDQTLYYFRGLRPHEHYIPFDEFADLERIVATRGSSTMRAIRSAARRFAMTYLSPDAVVFYTRELLAAYQVLRAEAVFETTVDRQDEKREKPVNTQA